MKHIIKSFIATTIAVSAFAANGQQQNGAMAAKDPNPSARFGTKESWNFFIAAEALAIKPFQPAVVGVTENLNTVSVTTYQPEFVFGGRGSLGINTSYDGWDAVLTYTGFNYKHSNAFNIDNESGTVKLYNFYNQGDLDFGRMFAVSRKLNLRPHAGVRGIWMKQKSEAQGPDTNSTTSYKDYLVGAEAGCDSLWKLSKEFSAYANLGFSTLVLTQKISVDGIGGQQGPNTINTDRFSKIVTGLDFAIGFRWDRDFKDGEYHFGINAGYEHHSLTNLNDISTSGVGYYLSGGSVSFPNDYSWQAIALGFRFDF